MITETIYTQVNILNFKIKNLCHVKSYFIITLCIVFIAAASNTLIVFFTYTQTPLVKEHAYLPFFFVVVVTVFVLVVDDPLGL